MHERPLAFHEEELTAAAPALDDEALRGAGEEVGDDGVDGDPPPCDRDPGLTRGNELRGEAAGLRGAVELERDRHLPDRAVRADGEHDVGVDLEVLARRAVEPGGRPAQVAQLDAVTLGERPELRVVADELVQPVLEREPVLEARAQQDAPGGREAAPLGRDADEGDLRPVRQRRSRRRPRSARPPSVSPARVESRIATTSSLRYRSTPRIVFP